MPSCESVLGLWAEGRQTPLHLQKHQPGHASTNAAGPVIAQQLDDRNRAGTDAKAPQQEAAYTAMLDLKPGDEFEIKLGRKQIKLIPLGSTEEV